MCIHVTCSYTSNSPERKFVPSVSASSVPSVSESLSAMEMRLSQQQQQQHSPHLSPSGHTPTLSSSPSQQPLCHSATISSGFKWVSDLCHRGKNLSQMHLYANKGPLKSFNRCSVCRVRMMCLPDLLYLNSTAPMSIPLLCPLCPGSLRSSDTLLYEASNDSQTSANETERLASTVMETVRYMQCEAHPRSSSTSAKSHSNFSVYLRWNFGLS